MKLRNTVLLSVVAFAVFFAAFLLFSRHHAERRGLLQASTWQHMVTPGGLSQPHAFLENNCAACHTPVKGVEAQSCIVCHADNKAVLQRQPTAFHADVRSCVECHVEHRGVVPRPTDMDHAALARLGLRQLSLADPAGEAASLRAWLDGQPASVPLPPGSPPVTPHEAALNCATCHANEDRHRGFFGTSCVQCHSTTAWTIPAFRHPSPASASCAQCHQAPPSHYMMHFEMLSMKVARQERAQVNECFKCHQTTSWNDIKGVGWYKHH